MLNTLYAQLAVILRKGFKKFALDKLLTKAMAFYQ